MVARRYRGWGSVVAAPGADLANLHLYAPTERDLRRVWTRWIAMVRSARLRTSPDRRPPRPSYGPLLKGGTPSTFVRAVNAGDPSILFCKKELPLPLSCTPSRGLTEVASDQTLHISL